MIQKQGRSQKKIMTVAMSIVFRVLNEKNDWENEKIWRRQVPRFASYWLRPWEIILQFSFCKWLGNL